MIDPAELCNFESVLNIISCIDAIPSNVDVNPNLNQKYFEELREAINRNYLEANDIVVEPYNYEMNIR